jgi:hypothetical protein
LLTRSLRRPYGATPSCGVHSMLKILIWIVVIIFLIGLLVVSGLLDMIF